MGEGQGVFGIEGLVAMGWTNVGYIIEFLSKFLIDLWCKNRRNIDSLQSFPFFIFIAFRRIKHRILNFRQPHQFLLLPIQLLNLGQYLHLKSIIRHRFIIQLIL